MMQLMCFIVILYLTTPLYSIFLNVRFNFVWWSFVVRISDPFVLRRRLPEVVFGARGVASEGAGMRSDPLGGWRLGESL